MAKVNAKKVIKRRKERKNVEKGAAHILLFLQQHLVTITDLSGNALSWASSGGLGFRGSKKSTPFAAQMAAETAQGPSMEHGLKTVEVYVKGPGQGPGGRHPRPAVRRPGSRDDQGRHSHSPQWLPSAQETPRLIRNRRNLSYG